VALGAALVCMLPGVGMVDARTFESVTSFGTFLYVAGLLGMVSLIDASGLARALGADERVDRRHRYVRNFLKSTGRFSTKAFRPSSASSVL